MKINKALKVVSLISLLAASICRAQVNPTAAGLPQDDYDPIVSMLDSLVSLNNVLRFNSLDENCMDKNGENCVVPVFNDQVYASRISQLNSPIPLSYNRYVKEFIQLYAEKKRSLTQRVMGLSNLYFPLYEEVFDREGLPLEFKYLSVVESALNPVAVSRVGATGLWQFMYNTGKMYNLKINSYTDERRDPVKATEAACRYFKEMYSIYGDWLLVIASYNCGPGNVNRAIKRSGGKTNFWEIMPYLPKETRGYVPAFIAVTYVMNYSREHNLYPVVPAYNYFQVDTVAVNRPVNFRVLSAQLDLPMDVISYLNPLYKKNIIPAGASSVLRLPVNKIAQFLSIEEAIYAQSAPSAMPVLPVKLQADDDLLADASGQFEYIRKKSKKIHTVRRGETLSTIADRYDMTVSDLKKMNRLRTTKLVKGQKLHVVTWTKIRVAAKAPDVANNDSSKAIHSDTAVAVVNDDSTAEAKTETPKKTASRNTSKKFVYHVVQPGDTLWNIARRYDGVTVEQIKDINNLRNSQIKVGTRLKLMLGGNG